MKLMKNMSMQIKKKQVNFILICINFIEKIFDKFFYLKLIFIFYKYYKIIIFKFNMFFIDLFDSLKKTRMKKIIY